jgi:hypothetical protein
VCGYICTLGKLKTIIIKRCRGEGMSSAEASFCEVNIFDIKVFFQIPNNSVNTEMLGFFPEERRSNFRSIIQGWQNFGQV